MGILRKYYICVLTIVKSRNTIFPIQSSFPFLNHSSAYPHFQLNNNIFNQTCQHENSIIQFKSSKDRIH